MAWAEGMIQGNRANTVLHWVVNDPQCYQLYQSYLDFAFEPEITAEEVLTANYNSNEQMASSTFQDSLSEKTRTSISARLDAWWRQLLPIPAVVAVVAVLFAVVPLLITQNAPVKPKDFVNSVPSPAANWRFLAAVETTGRSPQTSAQADDQQALRFGMRTMISELGIAEHPDVRAYFNSLPVEYPFCSSTDDSCESAHKFHYDLGRWSMLTERICRASLAEEERGEMLGKQVSEFTMLMKHLNSESLSIDNQLKSILDAPEETACSRTDKIYRWSHS